MRLIRHLESLPPLALSAFPVARLRLGGATQAFRRPIVLSPNRDWWIVGPGTLDAALTGADTGRCTRVCLDDCVLLNRTRRGPSEAALRYPSPPSNRQTVGRRTK